MLSPLGFAPDAVRKVFTDLRLSGYGSLSADGQMALSPELCPPADPVPSPRDRILETFRKNDCTLSEEALRQALPDIGEAQMQAVLGPILNAGDMTVSSASATLKSPLCPEGAS